ncbi:hypothetical protein DFS34DRAFT_511693 [Phlyctochytrium arcticum]|nr:hypothetical protein DFS34DRAFT_511693 [Phlyctochytrium arcticum]
MPVQGRLVSAKEFENSGREVSIDEAGFPDADLVLNSSIGSRIESQASLGDLVEDEEYEAATHTFVIQPWRSIKRLIAAVLAKAPTQSTSAAGSHVSLSSKEHVQGRSGTLSPQPTQQATILPVTIPHGFQLARHLGHHRPTVKTALYIPSPHVERFATLDSHHVNIWRGSRSLQIPTGGDRGAAKTTVAGLSRWLYIAKWKVIIIATLHLELKILDANFEEIASVSSVKPVLSLEYNDDADELIAGGVGNIRIWSFRRSGDGRAYRLDPPRLIIEDLGAEDWVAHAVFQKTSNRIYAAIDNRIHIYDYEDGKRIDTLYDVHDLSITALAFYEPLGTLITASRDSTIKVWNRQNNLIHELREHSHAVTGIAVIPPPEKKGRGLATLAATPYFLSCSLDGTIRMWNAEVGACTYSLQTPQECLGIRMIKPDCFMHFAKDRVCIWNLNRFYSTFAYIRSQTTQILRASHPLVPARIIAAAEDGSLRILSPVTGAVLSMGFPVMHERTTLDMIYDLKQNIAWLLSDDSALAVYSTKTNPCAILGEWQVTLSKSKLTCMTAISTASHSTQDLSEAPVVYGILGGTDTGQVMLVDVRRNGEQSVVVQAHTAEIHTILFEPSTMQLFTSGKDNTLKIWSLSVTTTSFQTLNGADPIALAAWYANANLSISATLVGNVSTEGLVHRMLWFSRKRLLLCAIGNRPVIYGFGKKGLGILRSHSSDDDHLSEITMLALCDMNRIFATSSLDGSVKIWDAAENVLIRELQFAEPIATLCFANPRGDLLISLPDQIVLVKLQDYMPIPYLRLLYERGDIPDDVPEDPTLFDSNLDFWQLYKEEVEEGEIAWHVDEKLKNDGLGSQSSNLNELENIREQKEQATLKAAEEAAKPKRVRKAVHRMVVTTLNDPIDFSTIFETQEPSLYVPQIMHTVDEEKFMEDEATIMEEPDNQEPESQLPVAIMLSPRVIPQQSTEQIYARARKRRMSSLGRQGAEKQTHGAEHDSSDTSSEDVRDSVSHAKDPAPLAHSSHENRRPSAAVRELTMSRAGSSQLHIGRSGEVGPGGQDAMRQELAKRRLLGRADELRRMTSADSGRRKCFS